MKFWGSEKRGDNVNEITPESFANKLSFHISDGVLKEDVLHALQFGHIIYFSVISNGEIYVSLSGYPQVKLGERQAVCTIRWVGGQAQADGRALKTIIGIDQQTQVDLSNYTLKIEKKFEDFLTSK